MFEKTTQLILDALFPISCVLCSDPGALLCAVCESKLPLQLTRLSSPTPHLASITICANYEEQRIQKLIFAFKFNGLKGLSVSLGNILQTAMPALHSDTAIIPIPLHRRRERNRGFNQSALLAQELAKTTGLPLDTQLKRIRARRPQHTLNRAERLENLKGAFSYNGAAPAHVLLIDDITTTFSTLDEAASELKKHGTKTVHALVVAKNQP